MQADDAGDGKAHSSVDLAQGLVAGWMSDQVNDRGKSSERIGLGIAVVGLLVAVLASGWWRGLGIFALCLGLAFFAAIWLLRKAAHFAIARFAEPKSMTGSREEINSAIDEVDLPTSPLAIVRFLSRLRKGPGPELDRIKSVVGRLNSDLKAD